MDLYNQLMNLVDQGLVTRKVDLNGYQIFKYHRKVFYNNLWHLDDALLEARGIIFDKHNQIAQRPFKKIFNLGENGMDIYDDHWYVISTKINGFMGAVSYHGEELLVSTTGSTTSDYVDLVYKHLDKHQLGWIYVNPSYTYLFEICDPSDPHIVEEEDGAWLIGIRNKFDGEMLPLDTMREVADIAGFKYKGISHMIGGEIRQLSKTVQHEGFVVYEGNGIQPVLKIKSPHYLSKKALMRMGKNAVNGMYDHPQRFLERLDEEFYQIFQWILDTYTKDEWAGLNEQQRRKVIEEYFDE